MGFFLGFIPNEQSNYEVRKVVGNLGRVFDGQNVNVRWVKPETYHITLVYLGERLGIIKKMLLDLKLKKIVLKKFSVRLDKANLGIQRSYKELVYLSLLSGGDEIRDMLYQLGLYGIRTKDYEIFIPHVTLGRVNKVVSDEEYKNLSLDVRNVNKDLKVNDIRFDVKEIHLIESSEGSISVIKSYPLV